MAAYILYLILLMIPYKACISQSCFLQILIVKYLPYSTPAKQQFFHDSTSTLKLNTVPRLRLQSDDSEDISMSSQKFGHFGNFPVFLG